MDDEGEQRQRNWPTVYSNNVHVGVTAYDFALTFGVGVGDEVERQVVVHMSPQHARSLHLLLERFLGVYEREIGTIALPDSLIQQLRGEASSDEPSRE